MPISGTPQPKALILAAAPDALAAEADRQGIQGIVFLRCSGSDRSDGDARGTGLPGGFP